MIKVLAAAACSALMTGCAGIGASDCGPDWYSIGQRDGRMGADSQIDNYASRCSVQVDRARYTEGWQAGAAMRPRIAAM